MTTTSSYMPSGKIIALFFVCMFLFSACKQNEKSTETTSPDVISEKIEPMSIRNNYIPNTISLEAQKVLKAVYASKMYERSFPAADDLEGWRKTHAAAENAKKEPTAKVVAQYGATVKADTLGGTPVVHIYPKDWKDNGKVLIYTHGGAYTLFSAWSTLNSAVPMATTTGLHVISVDYTTAPFGTWEKVQAEVVAVFKDLLKSGYKMKDIGIYGDSAGGGLAMSTVLNLRDAGLGIPAVAVLMSPWADISDNGDTYHTLENTDPSLQFATLLKSSAMAYAGGLELTDPRVSPVYGDFSKGFSPTMITEGTKCIFLSNSVRTYQAIEAAGVETKLDIYEGMWHVFQLTPMPESTVCFNKMATFINKHLK